MRSVAMISRIVMLFCFLILSCHTVSAATAPGEVFRTQVGDIRVDMLPEVQRMGKQDILLGVSSEDIAKFIPSGTYPSAVAVFLVRTPNRTILIDTGYGTKVAENLAFCGVKPEDIDAVLITHSHGDHIGGLLKDGAPAFPNASVYIAKPEYEWSESVREKLAPYRKVEQFTPGGLESGDELIPGIRPIAAYGHTPGHTLFMIGSKGRRLLVWGDLTHAMAIQMPMPGISVTYDKNPVEAAVSRRAVLKYVSDNKIPVGGMHIAFPGMGRVAPDPKSPNGYSFDPLTE